MSFVVNLINLVLAAAATIIVLFGETNRNGRLTPLGRVAASCLVIGLIVGIALQAITRGEDDAKQLQMVELSQRAQLTNDLLEQQKKELDDARTENTKMREALARIPQERMTASISPGQGGVEIGNTNGRILRRFDLHQGPSNRPGPPLMLHGGERVRYNVGFRKPSIGQPTDEPEVYLMVGSWRYPLINSGEFVVFPNEGQPPLKAYVIANLFRDAFDVHLVVQATDAVP